MRRRRRREENGGLMEIRASGGGRGKKWHVGKKREKEGEGGRESEDGGDRVGGGGELMRRGGGGQKGCKEGVGTSGQHRGWRWDGVLLRESGKRSVERRGGWGGGVWLWGVGGCSKGDSCQGLVGGIQRGPS